MTKRIILKNKDLINLIWIELGVFIFGILFIIDMYYFNFGLYWWLGFSLILGFIKFGLLKKYLK